MALPTIFNKKTPVIRVISGLGLIGMLLMVIILPIFAATAPANTGKAAVVDPAQAPLTALVKEVVNNRLLECTVSNYHSEPSKKLVQIKAVAVLNKYFPELSYQFQEKESGYIFKKMFTSKYPIKRVEIRYFDPSDHKELAYNIVLTEKEAKSVNWNQVDNIEFGSIAVYLWPLPDKSCVGFGDF